MAHFAAMDGGPPLRCTRVFPTRVSLWADAIVSRLIRKRYAARLVRFAVESAGERKQDRKRQHKQAGNNPPYLLVTSAEQQNHARQTWPQR